MESLVSRPPRGVNEFIEQQLDERAHALEDFFKSDFLAFTGLLVGGVDDAIRDVIEEKRQQSRDQTELTIVATTMGGYIEVVQRIVETIRHHYDHVNFVVPNYAYSAGTVLVMSADEIYMDYYSRLGPIDPQVATERGVVPALGYLIQWERLIEKARKGEITMSEVSLMIQGFNQAELYKYEQAREHSITLLKEWLAKYKFKNWKQTATQKNPVTDEMRAQRAEEIARELNNTNRWHTHGHGISMEVLQRDLNLLINDYGETPELSSKIRNYSTLLDDYMVKHAAEIVLHTPGTYLPLII